MSNTDESQIRQNINEAPIIAVTKWERLAFYVFGFATEPYYATALGVAIPVILETLSAMAGFEEDLITPCDINGQYTCKVNLAGTWYDTTEFTLYVNAVSVAMQALVFINISSFADYGNLRKYMMLGFSFLTGIILILFLAIRSSSLYWVVAIFYILTNVLFGASYVFYYAYINTLTAFSPETLEVSPDKINELQKVRERVANNISSKGFASGALGGVISLLASAGILFATMGEGPLPTYPLQIVCSFIGGWMIFFLLFTLRGLENRPGPPLPQGENYLVFSWKLTYFTFSHLKNLSQIFIVLFSWFIMSDTIGSVATVSILFAKREIALDLFEILVGAIIIPLAAFFGSFFWIFIQSRFNLTTKTMVLITSGLYLFIPIYFLIGLAPSITFGVKSKAELYFIAAYDGFVLVGIQSFYRVLFSELIPIGKENEFFGLYELTDKGSSWIGPLVIGAISGATGSTRLGFAFLLVSIIVSWGLMYIVNPEKGLEQAKEFRATSSLLADSKVAF